MKIMETNIDIERIAIEFISSLDDYLGELEFGDDAEYKEYRNRVIDEMVRYLNENR